MAKKSGHKSTNQAWTLGNKVVAPWWRPGYITGFKTHVFMTYTTSNQVDV